MTIGPNVADYVGNLMNQNGDNVNGSPDDRFTGDVLVRLPDLAVADLTVLPGTAEFGDQVQVDSRCATSAR